MTSRLLHRATRYALYGVCAVGILAITPNAGIGATPYPDGVTNSQFGHGTRLTDTQGMTLYQFENDLREPGTSTCNDDCAVKHPPLLATDIPAQIPSNWTLIERDDGAQQWAFQGMPLYRSQMDSHKGADYGQGQGWIVAFETIKTPPELSVTSTVLGHVLASSDGLTLYVNNSDEGSAAIECDNTCLETWVPAKAPWAATNYGDFSVHARADGIYQWAYQDKPLFLFSGDSERGDLNGDGVDGLWSSMLLEPAPPMPDWVKVVGSDGGPLYADSNGMTLYTLYEDRNGLEQTRMGGNQCDEACLDKYWTAVPAPSKTAPVGSWSVIERGVQTLQWAYMGRPLYTLNLETRPGQLFYTTFRQFQWMKPIMYSLPALQGVFF
jgi:predicted lipoprotein with Yx(FWY)xxD motif